MTYISPSQNPVLYEFSNSISQETLCAYLSRAVTYNDALSTSSLEDDLRLLQELEACFLGRSAYVWKLSLDDDEHFRRAERFSSLVHAMAPHVICQAAVFEAVYPGVNDIPIPAWVFEHLGEPVETRTFQYDDMFGSDFERVYHWRKFGDGCQVPDFRLPETRRWFYYRCCRYIHAGYEAIHLGQPHLYAGKDFGYKHFAKLLSQVRAYASQHARRGLVLLDAHTHGIVVDGKLLFDFHSRPMSARTLVDTPFRLVLQHKGDSLGGMTPSGWECDSLPYLVEVDNWGGWSVPPDEWHDMEKRKALGRWGWDDVSWLAHQDEETRNNFVSYAYRWLQFQDPVGFFQYPTRRLLAESPVTRKNFFGQLEEIRHYHANRPSVDCPLGSGQEDAIKEAWSQPEPVWLSEWRQRVKDNKDEYGRQGAEPVVLVGSLQQMLGGIPGESMCPFSRMQPLGDGIYGLATVIPYPGEYEFSVAVGGTMTEVYRQEGLNGTPSFQLNMSEPNLTVYFRFDLGQRELTMLDEKGNVL